MPTVKMSDSWCKSIKVEKGREIFHDLKESGLGLRVSHTGRKVWQYLYRMPGNPNKQVFDLGEFPAYELREAREMAQEIAKGIKRGIDPKGTPSGDALTFKKLSELYLEKYAKPQKRSWKKDEQRLETLCKRWGEKKATDIKRKDVLALIDEISAHGLNPKPGNEKPAPIEANRTLALIRVMYNWAISKDMLEANPCLQVKAASKESHRERVLNETEIKAVWKACEELSPAMCALFRLRLLTAQRGGEVESMRWADIDPSGKWWTIPGEIAKNGLSHRVPISEPAKAILDSLKNESPWVFPSKSEEGHITNCQKALIRLREKSEVSFIAHDLRRTAASWMASIGVPRLTISKVLNHSEAGVTQIYDRHSYDKEKAQALSAWAEKLIGMVTS